MRLGQISVIHFLSKILSSVLGFAATIYIAQLLGAGVLGTYSVAIAVVSWLGLMGNMGITGAIQKRVSEQEEPAQYAIAGVIIQFALFVFLTLLVVLFRGYINDYVGFEASGYIVGMLAVLLGYNAITGLLNGQHMVHLSGVFSPVKTGSRAGLQIAALFTGLGLSGLLGGYILGYLVVISLGAIIVVRSFEEFTLPQRYHFQRLYSYAKFSWLGGLRSKAFNWVDIVVLGFFVQNAFIGYYTAAWNIAQFLIIFGSSMSQTLFPEMSKISSTYDPEAVSELLNTALSYAGLFLIPGLIGGSILGERILRIYGPDFTQAEIVLAILIVATLIQAYQAQFTTTLNAIDRPDLAFRVNMVFVGANLILNVILIYFYGWIGAAVATASSVAISLCVAYHYLSSIIRINIPIVEIGNQWIAGVLMGGVVFIALRFEDTYINIGHNVVVILSLVALGAAVYFAALLAISAKFRATISDNLPV